MRVSKNRGKRCMWIFLAVSWIMDVKADPMPMVVTLASMLSGYYSNIEQYRRDQANNVSAPEKHLWLQLYYTQANVPVLSPAVTVYYEQYVNNASTPSRQQILAFTQMKATQVRMTSYSILNVSKLSINREDGLKNLNLSELSNRHVCDALWEELEVDFYTSYLATPRQCIFMYFGQMVIPEGNRNLTCSGMTLIEVFVSVNESDVVSGTYQPYNLIKSESTCQEVTTPMYSRVIRTRCELVVLGFGLLTIVISSNIPV
ncbi:hypothetical protein RRG08_028822 [Elysia crispata]|uniref:Secreted protein n=1 Tax=Elysia crispata TaxID=231223 RepID=A0AAE0XSZ7_9GAST|nr:hypothetical protein RRG08_028822 [Elysia crispata]